MSMDLVYSVVIHPAKRELGITTLQYMLADSIYHLSHGGWCIATRPYFAELFDCDRSTVQRNLAKLEEKLLIERDQKTDYLRTTILWRDTVIFRERLMLQSRTTEPPQNAAPPPQNAAPRGRKMRHNNDSIDNDGKNKVFTHTNSAGSDAKRIPPTLESVIEYFSTEGPARGLPAEHCAGEAERFFNYFVQYEWKMSRGKGSKMKNWHLASNTWIGNEVKYRNERSKKQPPKPQGGSQMSMLQDLFNAPPQ